MEQQNPQENETSPNIQTGKSWFFLFLKYFYLEVKINFDKNVCDLGTHSSSLKWSLPCLLHLFFL